ncbi:hypothetical protein MAA_09675 [Metarhizium robertsii ARSEF 23]|uniref:Peptidase M43 family protein n=1 Tax=Metarhizium robertsii (strain ARSEF 23 / ATCC MYA-3075) TaxID=655844 RepID=E9FBM6_METRA|nr:uncharacterized protein MAA_09675 [Metarhizium robertsii ARSEF 23]EFY94845.2 hypothetical protein MAA_09675 [Metarhizium robertsii ARSEF 23]
MVMLPLLVSGLMAAVSVAGPMDMRAVGHHCATRSPLEERGLFARQRPQQNPLPDDGQEINLGFVLHFCCGGGSQCPSDSVAEKAVEDMNGLFANGKIKFNLQNVSRIADPLCISGVTDNKAMDQLKSRVHQGNTTTLNIVYVPTNSGAGTKGMCIVPEKGTNISKGIGDVDGCVVAMDTLPKSNSSNGGNGRLQGNNGSGGRLGGLFGHLFGRQDGGVDGGVGGGGDAHISGALATSVHETGHWLGELHAGGGGDVPDTANVMVPWSIFEKQYSFTADQFQRMRQTALARVNDKNTPVANKTDTGPVDGVVNTQPQPPQPPIENGDGVVNTQPHPQPPIENGDGVVNTQPHPQPPIENGDGVVNTHPQPHPPFGNGNGGDNTAGQGNPVRPTNSGFNPIGNGDGGVNTHPRPHPPFGNGNGGDNTAGQGNPVRPTNSGFNPIGNGDGVVNTQNPHPPSGNGNGGDNTAGQGNPVGPINPDFNPNSAAFWAYMKQIFGDRLSGFEVSRIGARAEPEAEADESGLVHIARREGTEAEADASGLVHIARRDDAGEPDGSGLVHIARK